MGIMGVIGNALVGVLLRTRLYSLLIVISLTQAGIAVALIVFGGLPIIAAALLITWGFLGTAAPAVWWTWLSKVLPDDAEAGGGLFVAVVQLAITVGATAGGILYDRGGHQSTFTFTALMLSAAATLVFLASRAGKRQTRR
jgi:predicted MFS family arabinose efflux permease